jgi:hypothetical protein
MRFYILSFMAILVISNILSTKKLIANTQCDVPTAQETVRIYFANGMNNSSSDARESRDRLKTTLGMSHMDFGLSYNANKNWIKEFLQVLHQRNNASKDFWY